MTFRYSRKKYLPPPPRGSHKNEPRTEKRYILGYYVFCVTHKVLIF